MTLNELLGDLEMHPNDDGKLIVDLELEKFNILIGKLHELNNNWNELKKWLEECLKEQNKNRLYDNNSYQAGVIDTYENVIDKMQELEQGKDE